VTQAESRLREAAKLGFRRALAPQAVKGGRATAKIEGLDLQDVGHLQEMIDWLYNESRSNSVPKRSEGSRGIVQN
jgi:DNA repair protein RadA/Sms